HGRLLPAPYKKSLDPDLDPRLLHTDIQQFIDDHLDADLPALALKGLPFEGLEVQAVMEQIESKKRSQKKLPTWFGHKTIYYPNKLNIEQTSSETTARYKSGWVQGSSIIDLTGGFGVDSFYFSKRFDAVTHCEVDAELSAM